MFLHSSSSLDIRDMDGHCERERCRRIREPPVSNRAVEEINVQKLKQARAKFPNTPAKNSVSIA